MGNVENMFSLLLAFSLFSCFFLPFSAHKTVKKENSVLALSYKVTDVCGFEVD